MGYGFERLWEGLIGSEICVDVLLYGLDIERRLLIVAVHIISSSRNLAFSYALSEESQVLNKSTCLGYLEPFS